MTVRKPKIIARREATHVAASRYFLEALSSRPHVRALHREPKVRRVFAAVERHAGHSSDAGGDFYGRV